MVVSEENLSILIEGMIAALLRDGILRPDNRAINTTINTDTLTITVHFTDGTDATFDLRTKEQLH